MTNIRTSVFLSLLLLIAILFVSPVSASLKVSGTVKYMTTVSPGEMVTFPITVSIGDTDPATDYELTVFGFDNSPQGNYVTVPGNIPQSAVPYLTLDKSLVHIQQGKSETVTATLRVPQEASGGMYALINIRPAQATQQGAGAGVATAINIPVMATVSGTGVTEKGTIDLIAIDATRDPVSVTTTFTNTGNHHYYGVRNVIEISNSNGMMVGQFESKPLVTAIVPGGTVEFMQDINIPLVPDTYTVTSLVMYNGENVLDHNTNQFTVNGAAGGAVQTRMEDSPGIRIMPAEASLAIILTIILVVSFLVYRSQK